jgi:hypothetical protein
MKVHGEGGVLMSLEGCMRWDYGRILGVGRSICHSRFKVRDLRLDFCMISGVGRWPLRKPF